METIEKVAVDSIEQHLKRHAKQNKRDDAIPIQAAVAVGALCEEPRNKDEERHVEEVDAVEYRIEHGVVALDGKHEVSGDYQDDEQALDVVEQCDALMLTAHGIPPIDEAVVALAILSQESENLRPGRRFSPV